MINFIVILAINSLALYLTSLWVPGIHIKGGWTIVAAALVLTILNKIVRPLLLLLTLPVNILTLGLFTFVVLGLIFWLGSALVPGFKVDGLGWAIVGALVMGLINGVVGMVFDL